jgi:hypothetical protein
MSYHYGSPWIGGTVDDQGGVFLLDTGASLTVVDEELAERGGGKSEGSFEAVATTGRFELPLYRAEEIRFAGITERHRLIGTQDLSGFHAPGGGPQGGLIGTDLLSGRTVVLDMAASRVAISSAAAPIGKQLDPHQMPVRGTAPLVELFFGPEQQLRLASLDTGNGYASRGMLYLDVAPDVAKDLLGADYLTQEPDDYVRIVSLAGRSELPIFYYGPVRCWGETFSDVALVVHVHSEGAFARPGTILATGTLLRHFERVELDFPNRLAWVRPRR